MTGSIAPAMLSCLISLPAGGTEERRGGCNGDECSV